MQQAARDGEGQHQLAALLAARVRRLSRSVAVLAQTGLDVAARVLEQIEIDGAFRADRHEIIRVATRQRIAGEDQADARPGLHIDRHRDGAAVLGRHAALADLRLVIAARRAVDSS